MPKINGPGFDSNFNLLEQLMTISSNKQKVIANNIANVNTPGYRRRELVFQEEILRAVEEQDMEHLGKITGKIIESDSPTFRNDGNNVDIDKEMAEQAKNSIRFAYASELIGRQFRGIKSAIRGESVR